MGLCVDAGSSRGLRLLVLDSVRQWARGREVGRGPARQALRRRLWPGPGCGCPRPPAGLSAGEGGQDASPPARSQESLGFVDFQSCVRTLWNTLHERGCRVYAAVSSFLPLNVFSSSVSSR